MSGSEAGVRDIVVIGGGVLGAAVAWALSRQGLGERVLVLERLQPASGATSRAAALVTLLRDDPAMVELARETLRAIAELEDEDAEDVGRRQVGSLHVGATGQGEALDALAARCSALGIEARRIGRDQVLVRAGWLAPDAIEGGVFVPDDCYVEPYLLCTANLRAASRRGVRLMTGVEARAIHHADGKVEGVELTDGSRIAARVVVNAAGPWANLLSADAGLPLPMAPVRSHYWITEPTSAVERGGPIVFLSEIRAYARPEVGALLFGIREQRLVVADPRGLPADLGGFVFDARDPEGWESLAEGAADLARYFPGVETLGMAHYINGPSNYTPDGRLVVGADPALDGLYVASGCNGSGITFSGGIGRLIAEMVCQEPTFVPATAFVPARLGTFDPFSPQFLAVCAAARARKSAG